MSITRKLRLGPLPKTETVKVAFTCPASLRADLDRYAALHGQLYGEPVDAVTLIPHMLEAFMARDRGFKHAGPTTKGWSDLFNSNGRPFGMKRKGSIHGLQGHWNMTFHAFQSAFWCPGSGAVCLMDTSPLPLPTRFAVSSTGSTARTTS